MLEFLVYVDVCPLAGILTVDTVFRKRFLLVDVAVEFPVLTDLHAWAAAAFLLRGGVMGGGRWRRRRGRPELERLPVDLWKAERDRAKTLVSRG